MNVFLRTISAGTALLAGLFLMSGNAMADTPFPTINMPSKADKCITETEEMRKNHMDYILHERDETMYEGIRAEPASLANCIDCHVEPDANGKIASIDSPEHFCQGCHEYASVQIDCFQCHADKPQKFIERGGKTANLTHELHKALSSANSANNNTNADVTADATSRTTTGGAE